MTTLTIPPERIADTARARDFLFSVYGDRRWREADYLELSGRTNRLIELSDGRLTVFEMPTSRHQDIVLVLGILLRVWAQAHRGRAFVAAYPVRLWPGKFREPDVLLYAPEHLDRVEEQYGGPPDLAVEVLSPGTADLDTGEKMAEYALAGIPEYWIVHTESRRLDQYTLEGERYRLHAQHGAGETVRAATLEGLEFGLDAIYEVE